MHCGGDHPGRDSDCLPVLSSGLCAQRKPFHAVVHDTDRSFSETDRLPVPHAQCPRSLEPSIRHRLTWKYFSDRFFLLLLFPSAFPQLRSNSLSLHEVTAETSDRLVSLPAGGRKLSEFRRGATFAPQLGSTTPKYPESTEQLDTRIFDRRG